MKRKNIRIIAFQRGPKHYVLLQKELSKRNIDFEAIEFPEEKCFDILNCSSYKFNFLKNLLRKKNDELTILISSTTEFFPHEPDFIIGFSAYQSWFESSRFKIIPYVWEQAQVADYPNLEWKEKPKLSVGFLGNSYEDLSYVQFATKLPSFLKQQFITGKHLNYIYKGHARLSRILSLIPCFVRVEALRQLEISNLDSDIIRYSKAASITKQEITNYQDHMLRNTYVLCPRAIENYSFRFYETLAHGRVPVLIDTDTVLPSGVDWDELCVRVPYHRLNELEQIVRQDYESKTKQDFIDRQQKALKTMKHLSQFNWLQDIVEEIIQAAY